MRKIYLTLNTTQELSLLVEQKDVDLITSLLGQVDQLTVRVGEDIDLLSLAKKMLSSAGGKTVTRARIDANREKSRAYWASPEGMARRRKPPQKIS